MKKVKQLDAEERMEKAETATQETPLEKKVIKCVSIPVDKFNEMTNLLVAIPYKDSAPIIEILNKNAFTTDFEPPQ